MEGRDRGGARRGRDATGGGKGCGCADQQVAVSLRWSELVKSGAAGRRRVGDANNRRKVTHDTRVCLGETLHYARAKTICWKAPTSRFQAAATSIARNRRKCQLWSYFGYQKVMDALAATLKPDQIEGGHLPLLTLSAGRDLKLTKRSKQTSTNST